MLEVSENEVEKDSVNIGTTSMPEAPTTYPTVEVIIEVILEEIPKVEAKVEVQPSIKEAKYPNLSIKKDINWSLFYKN